MRYFSDFVVSVAGPMAGYVSFATGNFETLVRQFFFSHVSTHANLVYSPGASEYRLAGEVLGP